MQIQFGSYYAIKWATRQSTRFPSPLSFTGSDEQRWDKTWCLVPGSELLYRLWRGRGEEESPFKVTQVTLA